MLAVRSHSSHVVCFQSLCWSPPPRGTNTAPPPSRPRAIRARSEENSPRRHHRHSNRHRSRSRHDPQRGEIQPPAVAPQLRAPVPSAAPPAVPPGIGMWPRMLRLFAALRLLLHGIHRLVQEPHIEANLQCEQSPHLRNGHRPNQAGF